MKKLVISLLKRTDRKKLFQQNNLSDFHYIKAIDGNDHIFRNIKPRKDWLIHLNNDHYNKMKLLVFYHISKHGKMC